MAEGVQRRIAILQLNVGDARVEALVRVLDADRWRTCASPGIAQRALELLPGLRRHRCDNGSAHGIVAELADTETPHLMEHVACELMAMSGSPRTLGGATSWNEAVDGAGVARVTVEYDDDIVALDALARAADIVEWLLVPAEENSSVGSRPDVDAIVARLRSHR